MAQLERFVVHVDALPTDADVGAVARLRAVPGVDVAAFTSDEDAARYYISEVVSADARPGVRAMTTARLGAATALRAVSAPVTLPGTSNRLVRFEQTHHRIPVYGTHATCELTPERGFVSASGSLGPVQGVSAFTSISREQALGSIAAFAGVDASALVDIEPGRRYFFNGDDGRWRIALLYEDVPAVPLGAAYAPGEAQPLQPLAGYLVDARTAAVLHVFGSTPTVTAPPPIAVRATGTGEDGVVETLWGRMAGDEFELSDPSRCVVTFDLAGGNLYVAPFDAPFRAPSGDLGSSCKAVVSAHANSTRVHEFFVTLLQRRGIDNAGTTLTNVVNCTEGQGATWANALWWKGRMWYGQAPGPDGTMVSYARHLDILAHELTHGVTRSSANLEYRDESGALNESMSDIFAILIKNWYRFPPDGGDLRRWDWQVGPGLRAGGAPLRDLGDPARTGHPGHMRDYLQTREDWGGVHHNSSIHSHAAWQVMTAVDGSHAPAFTPVEVALLFYHALVRLGPRDGFAAALAELLQAATSLYAADPTRRDSQLQRIRDAYAKVGVLEPDRGP